MHVIGVDIGGTKIGVSVGTNTPSILDKEIFETTDPETSIEKIIHIIDKYIEKYHNIKAIGISCGGPLSVENGTILSPPNLLGWDNINICSILSMHTNLDVFLENDANACALAEFLWGEGRGSKNMCFITFGTGLGAGFILNGEPYRGASDMAGEIGHIRLSKYGPTAYGKQGSFEAFCSGAGITRLASSLMEKYNNRADVLKFSSKYLQDKKMTTKMLAEAALDNDEFSLSVFNYSANYLGRGLALLIDILNLEKIIIGGVYSKMEKYFYEPMMEVLQNECLSYSVNSVRVLKSSFGDDIGDYGAIGIALKNLI